MLGTIVNYMRNALVLFRLASYPSAEPRPIAAHSIPPGGVFVDTSLYFVDGRGEKANLDGDSGTDGKDFAVRALCQPDHPA